MRKYIKMNNNVLSLAVSGVIFQVWLSLPASAETHGFGGPKTELTAAKAGEKGVLTWQVTGGIYEPLVKIWKYDPERDESRVMFYKEANTTVFTSVLPKALTGRYQVEIDGGHVMLVVQDLTEDDAGVFRAELITKGGATSVALVALNVAATTYPEAEPASDDKQLTDSEEDTTAPGIGLFVSIIAILAICVIVLVVLLILTRKRIIWKGERKPADVEEGSTQLLPLNGMGPPKTALLPVQPDGVTVDLDLFVCHEERPERVAVNQKKAIEVERTFGDGEQITKWNRFCSMDSEESSDTVQFTLSEFLDKSGLAKDNNGSEQFKECVNRDPYLGKLLEIPVRSLTAACAEILYILVRSKEGSTARTTKLQWSLYWLQFIQNTSAEDFTPTEEVIEEGFDLAFKSKTQNVLMSIPNEERQNYFRYLALKRFHQEGLL